MSIEEELELKRKIHSDEHKNYWIKQGFSKEIVDKYPEEFYFIDWLYYHVNFSESFENYEEDTIRYFLHDEYPYPEEFLAEYFSHEWKKTPLEVWAIINKVKEAPKQ